MPDGTALASRPVLVVGGTGDLGGRIVTALQARGQRVRALVRPGSDPGSLSGKDAEIVRGDMLEPSTLGPAMEGVSTVVSSAIGYSGRRPGDSLKTDVDGNRNLVDAAKRAGVSRFVFLSILACDRAPDVPHFRAKKVTEDYLEQQGVPFVALRPGAFLGAPAGPYRKWMVEGLRKGRVMTLTPPNVRMTFVAPDEVARAVALAVDAPGVLGRRIDLGSDRPLSGTEFAELFGRLLGRPIAPRPMFAGGLGFLTRLAGTFNRRMNDMSSMGAFFRTGQYVADTRVQAELFGPVPKVEDAARRTLVDLGLLADRPNRTAPPSGPSGDPRTARPTGEDAPDPVGLGSNVN